MFVVVEARIGVGVMLTLMLGENSLKLPQDSGVAYNLFNDNNKLVGLTHVLAGQRGARVHSQRKREREPRLTLGLQQTREKQNKTHHIRFI